VLHAHLMQLLFCELQILPPCACPVFHNKLESSRPRPYQIVCGRTAGSRVGTEPAVNQFASYSIASGASGDIFTGDPVKSTGSSDANGKPTIVVAAAGNTVRGIFNGCEYTNAAGERIFTKNWVSGTAATDVTAYVFDDPNQVFSVQADGAFAITDVGNKADFVAGTGDSATGQSRFELDSSDIGTGDGLLILGLEQVDGNEVGSFAKLLVLLREHELRGALTAV